jgi:Contractile injection system tube protein
MAEEVILAKAELRLLKPDFSDDTSAEAVKRTLKVQFNPETLKVSYTNQIEKPDGAGDQRGSQSQLFVGSGSTKMSCTLWFDVNAPQQTQKDTSLSTVDDVRKLTNAVSFFIDAKADKKQKKMFIPPAVGFFWGSFQFRGIMESVEENLEFFSPQGKPLRASVAISLMQQKILIFPPDEKIKSPQKKTPGTNPTTPVPEKSSVQKMAGENWQGVAQQNNVENPRLPQTGMRLDLTGGN